jgi:putative transposase
MPRVVVPGYPHHVTQRGNRKQRVFFGEGDYRAYMRMVAKEKERAEVELWAYCLMPNHVHFVAVPGHERSLAMLFKEAHRKYTRRINSREGWIGHLWQERFYSFPMDQSHADAAVRYVELNPVDACICESPTDWPWSSVHAHFRGSDDLLVTVGPMLERFCDWAGYLGRETPMITPDALRAYGKSGRPAGDDMFIDQLERETGRTLRKRKPGRKKSIK